MVRFNHVISMLTFLVLGAIVVNYGFLVRFPAPLVRAMHILDYVVLGLLAVDLAVGYLRSRPVGQHWRSAWFDTIMFLLGGTLAAIGSYAVLAVALRQLVATGRTFARLGGFVRELQRRPVALLALSFLALIVVGTFLLLLPAATTSQKGASFITALFTAVSAVCVTGLTVVDIGTYFSRFGQGLILSLIQLGGLGIMTFYAGLAVLVGGRLGLGQRRTISAVVAESRHEEIGHTLRYIILFTVLAEVTGTLLLFMRWLGDLNTPLQAAYYALFHSVSAFCNAGFALYSRNLMVYQTDFLVNMVMMALIVTGGLGFSVVHELVNRESLRRSPREVLKRLSAHARMVLLTTAILIGSGAVLFLVLEFNNALAGLPLPAKLLAALFQAVTPRTAGFSTVPLGALRPTTIFLWSLLMFIGASPGGTGGGIKTTTAAVLFLTIRSRIIGREDPEFSGRSIVKDTVYRAASIAALAAGIVSVAFALLLVFEPLPFTSLLFEVVSAFGTVGLSTGITPSLSAAGKLCLVVLMFTGRVGPLTLALVMQPRERRLPISYPRARILVG